MRDLDRELRGGLDLDGRALEVREDRVCVGAGTDDIAGGEDHAIVGSDEIPGRAVTDLDVTVQDGQGRRRTERGALILRGEDAGRAEHDGKHECDANDRDAKTKAIVHTHPCMPAPLARLTGRRPPAACQPNELTPVMDKSSWYFGRPAYRTGGSMAAWSGRISRGAVNIPIPRPGTAGRAPPAP